MVSSLCDNCEKIIDIFRDKLSKKWQQDIIDVCITDSIPTDQKDMLQELLLTLEVVAEEELREICSLLKHKPMEQK